LKRVIKLIQKAAKAKVVLGCYTDAQQIFCYAIEAVIAPRTDLDDYHAGEIEIIDCVNDAPSSDGNGTYFNSGEYHWTNRRGNRVISTSINDILHECGFNTNEAYFSKRRKPCVLFINLKYRCIEYLGAAEKTHINTKPYADDIAKIVSKLEYVMSSYHGEGYGRLYERSSLEKDEDQNAIKYLVDFLLKRKRDVDKDPSLKIRDRLTQSSVWYRIRPIMIEAGFEPKKSWTQTRRYLTSIIDDLCKGTSLYKGEKIFPGRSITREDLGIVAAAKGIMFYQGNTYPVSIDNIKELARKGIGICVVEKEGIPLLLAPHAAMYGIALVTTGGRLTEYVKDLIEEIKKIDSNVWTLVDFDAIGNDIASSTLTPTPKIGIDRDIIRWLQENGFPELNQSDIEEEYTPPKGVPIDDEYLKHHRIELDSIVAKVGAEALWKYILYRIQLPEFSPSGFNLNKVITMPGYEEFYPPKVINALEKLDRSKDELLADLDTLIKTVLEAYRKQIEAEIKHTKELVPIQNKNSEIRLTLSDLVNHDKQIKRKAAKVTQTISNLRLKIESSWKRHSNTGKTELGTDTNSNKSKKVT
jgi:predicted RNase H-like HicB family nuclease